MSTHAVPPQANDGDDFFSTVRSTIEGLCDLQATTATALGAEVSRLAGCLGRVMDVVESEVRALRADRDALDRRLKALEART